MDLANDLTWCNIFIIRLSAKGTNEVLKQGVLSLIKSAILTIGDSENYTPVEVSDGAV